MSEPAPNSILKLFWYDEFFGTITDWAYEYPWSVGKLKLESAADRFIPIWLYFECSHDSTKDPPFDYLELQKGWSVENEQGKVDRIYLPGVVTRNGVLWVNFRFNHS